MMPSPTEAVLCLAGAAVVASAIIAALGSGPPASQSVVREVKVDKIPTIDIGPRTMRIEKIGPPVPIPDSQAIWPAVWPTQEPEEVVVERKVWKPDPKPSDVCSRRNLRKVWISSKRWRCRK